MNGFPMMATKDGSRVEIQIIDHGQEGKNWLSEFRRGKELIGFNRCPVAHDLAQRSQADMIFLEEHGYFDL